jgi:hypothetical protein
VRAANAQINKSTKQFTNQPNTMIDHPTNQGYFIEVEIVREMVAAAADGGGGTNGGASTSSSSSSSSNSNSNSSRGARPAPAPAPAPVLVPGSLGLELATWEYPGPLANPPSARAAGDSTGTGTGATASEYENLMAFAGTTMQVWRLLNILSDRHASFVGRAPNAGAVLQLRSRCFVFLSVCLFAW